MKGDALVGFVDGVLPSETSSLARQPCSLQQCLRCDCWPRIWHVATRSQQHITAICIKACHTGRVRPKQWGTATVRTNDIDRDISPGSDQPFFQRVVLSGRVAQSRCKSKNDIAIAMSVVVPSRLIVSLSGARASLGRQSRIGAQLIDGPCYLI